MQRDALKPDLSKPEDQIPMPAPITANFSRHEVFPDLNDMSWWFLRLASCIGIQYPQTHCVDAGPQWGKMLAAIDPDEQKKRSSDHKEGCKILGDLVTNLIQGCNLVGTPAFLRTGQGSGKHDWKNTCYVQDQGNLAKHVAHLILWSEMVDFLGLPYRYWFVRKFLPVEPLAILPDYADMPLIPEVRCFIQGGEVRCAHPYWPQDAIEQGLSKKLSYKEKNATARQLYKDADCSVDPGWSAPASLVARHFANPDVVGNENTNLGWSVDILWTPRDGWFVTDMALAERSYHQQPCPHQESMSPIWNPLPEDETTHPPIVRRSDERQ